MNLLTPAALEAAAKAMFETQQDEDEREYGSRDTWDQIHDSAKGYYLKYATIAFNAAIAKLIEEERAFDNLPGWENEIIIKKVKP